MFINGFSIAAIRLAMSLFVAMIYSHHANAADGESSNQLTFLNWGEYISDEVIAEFELEFDTTVKFIHFESDDIRDEILTTYGADGIDVMLVDRTNVPLYKKLGWIKEFDTDLAPNLNNLALPDNAGVLEADRICAPYFWGTTGIAYRKDLLSEPITSWQQIFNPSSELKGKIIMSALSEETIGMALKSLGYSMNSINLDEIDKARDLLKTQAPFVVSYSAIAVTAQESKLVQGKVSAVITYNGDAMILQDAEPNIEFVVPTEGGAIWVDLICLSTKANDAALAHKFINFINQPEMAAKNALFVYGATPNTEAKKLLPKDFVNNDIIFPTEELVSASEFYSLFPPQIAKKHNLIMRELKRTIKQQNKH